MGATWFNSQHRHLLALLDELGIPYFEQYMEGTAFFQPSPASPSQRIQIPSQAPSYRISGGTSRLINTVYQKLDKNDVLLNKSVTEIKFNNNSVQVIAGEIFEGNRVVLAIPPKLWSKKILFEPHLPSNLIAVATRTHTWMEDSIKVALTYKKPFWQQENLSGTLFSNTGPVTELYDHCDHRRSTYALCGFIHPSYKELTYTDRRAHVITQIKNVFGVIAETFIDYKECMWGEEENTFVASDTALYPHQNNGNPMFGESFFDDRLFISSSESASEFPGYMDGAVYSANRIAKKLLTP